MQNQLCEKPTENFYQEQIRNLREIIERLKELANSEEQEKKLGVVN